MGSEEHLPVWRATWRRLLHPPTPATLPGHSLGKVATDEDSAQWVFFVAHPHWWAHIQVAEGIQARGTCVLDLPGHVSEVRTLERHHQSTHRQKSQGGRSYAYRRERHRAPAPRVSTPNSLYPLSSSRSSQCPEVDRELPGPWSSSVHLKEWRMDRHGRETMDTK